MAQDDYAVLIAIENYPNFKVGGNLKNLEGPFNDLESIRLWLESPQGGHVPHENIHVPMSPIPPDPASPHPNSTDVKECFNKILKANMEKKKLGRFYVYASGHGFSPKRDQVSLFTAEAWDGSWDNVNLTLWLLYFQELGFFREYVLWADCCLDLSRILSGFDGAPVRDFHENMDEIVPTNSFIAHAALRPLKAVEKQIPEANNEVHGIFTWTLLEGLKGAAVDAYGRVTARSLGDWIRNAQVARLNQNEMSKSEISLEPDILREDPGLILVRDLVRKSYHVKLRFPSARESEKLSVTIWSGIPPQPLDYKRELDMNKEAEFNLEVGLYIVEVTELKLRQGIEVTADWSEETDTKIVERTGKPVNLLKNSKDKKNLFSLNLIHDTVTEIFVIDPRFQLIDRSVSSLKIKLPFGLYKLKTRKLRNISEKIILLDEDYEVNNAGAQFALPMMAVAPLPSSMATTKDQTAAFTKQCSLRRELDSQGNEAALTVMARVSIEATDYLSPSTLKPWEGVRVVNQKGKLVLDLSQDGKKQESDGAFAACTIALEPGVYFLQQNYPDGIMLEQSLILSKGWGLEAHMLRNVDAETHQLNSLTSISIHMHRLDQASRNADEDTLTEACRLALVDQRQFLNNEMKDKLFKENGNPLLAIIGAHLLIIDNLNRGTGLSELNTIVPNLRRQLGDEHPDVEAISLCCTDESLRTTKTVRIPPMFERSWRLLIDAKAKLITRSLAERALAKSSSRPYLVWSTDESIKDRSMNALALATWSVPPISTKASNVRTASFAADANLPMPASSLATTTSSNVPSRVASKEARFRAKKLKIPASLLPILEKKCAELGNEQPGTYS